MPPAQVKDAVATIEIPVKLNPDKPDKPHDPENKKAWIDAALRFDSQAVTKDAFAPYDLPVKGTVEDGKLFGPKWSVTGEDTLAKHDTLSTVYKPPAEKGDQTLTLQGVVLAGKNEGKVSGTPATRAIHVFKDELERDIANFWDNQIHVDPSKEKYWSRPCASATALVIKQYDVQVSWTGPLNCHGSVDHALGGVDPASEHWKSEKFYQSSKGGVMADAQPISKLKVARHDVVCYFIYGGTPARNNGPH